MRDAAVVLIAVGYSAAILMWVTVFPTIGLLWCVGALK